MTVTSAGRRKSAVATAVHRRRAWATCGCCQSAAARGSRGRVSATRKAPAWAPGRATLSSQLRPSRLASHGRRRRGRSIGSPPGRGPASRARQGCGAPSGARLPEVSRDTGHPLPCVPEPAVRGQPPLQQRTQVSWGGACEASVAGSVTQRVLGMPVQSPQACTTRGERGPVHQEGSRCTHAPSMPWHEARPCLRSRARTTLRDANDRCQSSGGEASCYGVSIVRVILRRICERGEDVWSPLPTDYDRRRQSLRATATRAVPPNRPSTVCSTGRHLHRMTPSKRPWLL